jgi:hypothetical protein
LKILSELTPAFSLPKLAILVILPKIKRLKLKVFSQIVKNTVCFIMALVATDLCLYTLTNTKQYSPINPLFSFCFFFAELHVRTDDAYLLRFLRAKKFDCERAFQLILKHFEVKCEVKNKDLFRNMRPSTVKHVLEDGVTGVLPHRDKFGRRVLIFRAGTVCFIYRLLGILCSPGLN